MWPLLLIFFISFIILLYKRKHLSEGEDIVDYYIPPIFFAFMIISSIYANYSYRKAEEALTFTGIVEYCALDGKVRVVVLENNFEFILPCVTYFGYGLIQKGDSVIKTKGTRLYTFISADKIDTIVLDADNCPDDLIINSLIQKRLDPLRNK
jgi:hypothetical protein